MQTLSDEDLLRVCRDALDAASVARMARALRSHTASAASRLRALRECVVRESSKIRLPMHIFVDQRDRRDAYRVICGMLVSLEHLWGALRESFVALSRLETSLDTARAAQQRLAALLEETDRREMSDRETVFELEKNLRKQRDQTERLAADFLKKRDVLHRFCVKTGADFSDRVSKIADLENEGAACDPQGAVRLCAELCNAIVATEQSLA